VDVGKGGVCGFCVKLFSFKWIIVHPIFLWHGKCGVWLARKTLKRFFWLRQAVSANFPYSLHVRVQR
jgi:hypothetical protein